MSQNYPQQTPRKLHSPLLDGYYRTENFKSTLKSKKTPLNSNNPDETSQTVDSMDETLDKTLFNKSEKNKKNQNLLSNKNLTNNNFIEALETCFKVAGIFICALGGILSFLQLLNIVTNIYNGNYIANNAWIIFGATLIGTILANVICFGFCHLVKITKFTYLSLEEQKSKLDEILDYYNRVNYKAK